MAVITVGDLLEYDPQIDQVRAQAMIDDAVAQATLVAPCLLQEDDLTSTQAAQFKSVLRAVVLRWDAAGTGAATSVMDVAGPFTHQETTDSTRLRRGLFWPSEVSILQQVCASSSRGNGTHDLAQPPARPVSAPVQAVPALAGAVLNGFDSEAPGAWLWG